MQIATKYAIGVWIIIQNVLVQVPIDKIQINISKHFEKQIDPVRIKSQYVFELGMSTMVRDQSVTL